MSEPLPRRWTLVKGGFARSYGVNYQSEPIVGTARKDGKRWRGAISVGGKTFGSAIGTSADELQAALDDLVKKALAKSYERYRSNNCGPKCAKPNATTHQRATDAAIARLRKQLPQSIREVSSCKGGAPIAATLRALLAAVRATSAKAAANAIAKAETLARKVPRSAGEPLHDDVETIGATVASHWRMRGGYKRNVTKGRGWRAAPKVHGTDRYIKAYEGGIVVALAEKTPHGWQGSLYHGLDTAAKPKRVSKLFTARNALALEGKIDDAAERYLERLLRMRKADKAAVKRARRNGEWQSQGPNAFAVSYGQGLHARAEKYASPKIPHRPWHGYLVRGKRRMSEVIHATTAQKLEDELEQRAQSWLLAYARKGRKR